MATRTHRIPFSLSLHSIMAKSLRSKSKRAFRRIKREDPKSDYNTRDRIRVARLSEKLKVLRDVSGDEAGEEEEEVVVVEELDDNDDVVRMDESEDHDGESGQGAGAGDDKGDSFVSKRNDHDAGWRRMVWLFGLINQDSLTLDNPAILRLLSDLLSIDVDQGC